MSAPAIALVVLGCGGYLLIGAWMSLSLGMIFALGGEPESWGILFLQIVLCAAVLFLWVPLGIVFLILALILAPFS